MANEINPSRRRFLEASAMTIAATPFCTFGNDGGSRELAVFKRAAQWINSPRLTETDLQGKVVLVNFWTYTCINWLRTLPYVRAWAEKYRERLVVIGVHTPEFGFEHTVDNVRRAAQQMRIDYPIAIDNDYDIWHAFSNHYWPALYFIDAHGRVRDQQFGEGNYDRAEVIIQRLLAEAGTDTGNQSLTHVHAAGVEAPAAWEDVRSRENYVGYERTEKFASPGGIARDRLRRYATPSQFALNQWALAGEWTMGSHRVVSSTPGARIVNRFHARDLHLVMGPARPGSPVRFQVTLDGGPPGRGCGVDVAEDGSGTVLEPRLYQLIRQPSPIVDRICTVEFLDAGVEAYAFTFG